MHIGGKEFRTIWFEDNIVKIIDQTKLPHHNPLLSQIQSASIFSQEIHHYYLKLAQHQTS